MIFLVKNFFETLFSPKKSDSHGQHSVIGTAPVLEVEPGFLSFGNFLRGKFFFPEIWL